MDAAALRASFPVLQDRAYLNAGTCGPLPAASAVAAAEVADVAMARGRTMDYFQQTRDGLSALRGAYAELVGATPDDIAITTSTSEGMVRVLAGLGLREGDEVVTSTTEHPGLLGPLSAARRRGIVVRAVALGEIAAAVGPATRLIACSHVDWTCGALAPDLSKVDVPVLLDGAQGAGAVPIDLGALGCAFYAAAGQKWLCGPVGTGLLYVAPAWRERLVAFAPTYLNLEDPAAGLDARAKDTAAAHDSFSLAPEALAAALAAYDVLAAFGWPAVYERAHTLAALLVARLGERGHTVAPRGQTTLVSWDMGEDCADVTARLAQRGVAVRSLPGTPYVRASVGAWNDESDLDRLLDGLS